MVAVRSNKEMGIDSSLDTNRPIQVTDWAMKAWYHSLRCMNDPQPEGHMASHIERRKFLATLGGAAAAWPLAARAQQAERMWRIGVLTSGATADDPDGRVRTSAFLQGLQQSGWIDGRNIRIDYRWGAGDADNMRKYAAELVALAPDVILASGTATVAPLLQAKDWR
jgi:hypothetical protein